MSHNLCVYPSWLKFLPLCKNRPGEYWVGLAEEWAALLPGSQQVSLWQKKTRHMGPEDTSLGIRPGHGVVQKHHVPASAPPFLPDFSGQQGQVAPATWWGAFLENIVPDPALATDIPAYSWSTKAVIEEELYLCSCNLKNWQHLLGCG